MCARAFAERERERERERLQRKVCVDILASASHSSVCTSFDYYH